MAFDYTTAADVFAYGNSAGTATDPVDEAALMATLVTSYSRALDTYCNQVFYQQAYADKVLRAVIDADGVLTCWPAVPTMSTPTSAAWRPGASPSWSTISVSSDTTDITTSRSGCVLRFLDAGRLGARGGRLQVKLSYTGGWANVNAVPADFAWQIRALCWWAYKKREAPVEKTASPEFGIITYPPGAWPKEIRDGLRPYMNVVPL